MSPPGDRALHAKNAIAFFAKHARFEPTADFAFAASKRTAKTEAISKGCNIENHTCGVAKRREGSE